MSISKEEIEAFGIGQLTHAEIEHAYFAFNALAELFSEEWVRAPFSTFRSNYSVKRLVARWNDIARVQVLHNSIELLDHIRKCEPWAFSELIIIGHLLHSGAEVELYPTISSRRVPDCKFRLSDKDQWIHTEISRRGLSEVQAYGDKVLRVLSEAAQRLTPDKHIHVAVLRTPTDSELQRVLDWLKQQSNVQSASFEDLAALSVVELDEDDFAIREQVQHPRCVRTGRAIGVAATQQYRYSIFLHISDTGAVQMLEAEAKQLPKSGPGVIILDITSIPSQHFDWMPLIARRFQPNLNRRISAVLLLQHAQTISGDVVTGDLLENPHATTKLTGAECSLLRSIFTPVDGP